MAFSDEQKRRMMEKHFSINVPGLGPLNDWNTGERRDDTSASQRILEMLSSFRPMGGPLGSMGQAPQGYMNMPGVMYPMDTSRVDKIPAIMEGIGGTVRMLAALSGLVSQGRKHGWGSLLEGFNFGGFGGGGGG